ncbi:MAG: methyltransferase [Gammaproteobacteria bacterium]|jgi:predicted methyltransferase|nr:methyltransferase [Gammaproteobacteria bacterium]MDH3757861.1 methyltransferase [Gammaproteobacteria bacterium]MDH3847181.1 methyltransferase [Gammaproteobacteria bacterium]MDH3864234.1 methyltransferase [Gammaproteobacteria bacterium]MDH3905659.1 methyltransferase [Gammaproteobacteria bacterium]
MNKGLLVLSAALAVAVLPTAQADTDKLAAVLAAQPDDAKARYQYRHPQETIEFFGIEPGMTVLEGLPGRGWYTKVLLPYLGSDGHLVGANYPLDLWPNFSFATEEFMAEMSQWLENWPAGAEEWRGEDGARIDAFWFGAMPDEMAGTADVVFFVRMLHNVSRFQSEGKGDYLDMALNDAYKALKPGGVLGVVQHHARDDVSDEWANGSHGYMKKQVITDKIVAAGFEFVAESDINANSKDQPSGDDVVWRLPPTYATSGDDEALKAKYAAIGESNRMTLKFRKPE